MDQKKILLCCGMGMSSGFLATSTRKVAKKNNLPYKIEARSESEVEQYISNIDYLLIGPHYANKLTIFREMGSKFNVPVDIIPEEIYGSLDGEALLDMIQEKIED